MTAKKVEFKVGDIVCSGGNTYRILSITREPTAKIQDLGVRADILTVRFSELATYAHFSPVTRIGRPPKTRKAVPANTEGVEVEQASTPETAPPTPGVAVACEVIKQVALAANTAQPNYPTSAEDIDKPTKVDLSTFELHVGGDSRQHRMRLAGRRLAGRGVIGKDLRPTLLRLLEQVGITAESDALLLSKLTLAHPDSEGRNLILKILKEGG